MGLDAVIRRRRAEREELLERARGFVAGLPRELDARAAVVYGSVARGDFNQWSDVDLLLVCENLPERFLDRFATVGDPPQPVQVIAWTPAEWRDQLARRNAIALDAVESGVWILGSEAALR